MDKYRLVEEKIVGAQGFTGDAKEADHHLKSTEDAGISCTVRVTQQAKPRSCITTAMNMLVRINVVVIF